MTKIVTTSVSELWLDDHNIVHMKFPAKNVKINIADSREIYEGRMKLPNTDTKQLLLVDLRTNPKPDREARDFTKSTEVVNITKAMAMLVGGPWSKVLGNFFIGFNRAKFPVSLFTKDEEAVDWLLRHK